VGKLKIILNSTVAMAIRSPVDLTRWLSKRIAHVAKCVKGGVNCPASRRSHPLALVAVAPVAPVAAINLNEIPF